MMDNTWKYWDIFDPNDYFGFVYKITNLTNGKFYIGKRQFFNIRNKKLTKKQLNNLPKARGRKPSKELVKTSNDWENYWGSSEELLKDVEKLGKENFERNILILCKTKKQLTYWEMHYQCVNQCLIHHNCYNDSILGKFFVKDLEDPN